MARPKKVKEVVKEVKKDQSVRLAFDVGGERKILILSCEDMSLVNMTAGVGESEFKIQLAGKVMGTI